MRRYLYYFPIAFIVLSNILYDISAKSFPEKMNAQAGMAIYYIAAAIISLSLFLLTSKSRHFLRELKKINWATFTLALGCTGLDLGYIRQLFFHETVSLRQYIGVAFCIAGIFVVFKAGSDKTKESAIETI